MILHLLCLTLPDLFTRSGSRRAALGLALPDLPDLPDLFRAYVSTRAREVVSLAYISNTSGRSGRSGIASNGAGCSVPDLVKRSGKVGFTGVDPRSPSKPKVLARVLLAPSHLRGARPQTLARPKVLELVKWVKSRPALELGR